MGTMNKMRENTGVVLWILVFAFGIIWVLQDSGGLDAIGTGGSTNIIVVDGDAITYEDFARTVDTQVQQYQQQTGETMPPQLMDQQREQVFEQMVENKLREHEMNRLGIQVTDDEVYEMVLGENPHPIIRTYFGDEEGSVNRALLQSFIDNPESRQDWLQIENYLRSERRSQKMNNLIGATVRVTEQDVLEEYRRRNVRVDAEWVGIRYATIPNDSVTVTDRDLRNYYNEHRDDFRRERTYTIQYVTRSKQPSPEDSVALESELNRLKPQFAEAEDDSMFLARNASQLPFSDAWFAANDLEEDIASAIFPDPEVGTVYGPIFSGDQAHLVKVRDAQPAEQPALRAQHILMRSPEDNAEIRQQLVDIRERIEADEATFEAMARQFSQDGSASQGGDLGWFGEGQMVEAFEDAAFDAPLNSVVGPIKTRFGYHLIRVTGRADTEVKLADYALQVRADVATLNNMQEQLEDLRYFAEEHGDFEAEAERLGLDVQVVQVESEQQIIPGLGNSRSILNFLQTADEGDISEVIELNDVFLVTQVQEVTPAGYRSFEEVRAELEPRVYIERKRELLLDRMRSALETTGNLEGLAQALRSEVRTANDITFETAVIPGLGREPKFVGTLFGLEEGETSGAVGGENAVFVVRATNVTEPPPITESQRQQIRDQLLQNRRTQVQNQWLTSLREQAEIEDYRYRFQQ